MSKKIICCVLPCLMLCLTLAVFGQAPAGQAGERGARGGGAGAAAGRELRQPRNRTIRNRWRTSMPRRKLAGNDAFLKYPYDFFCIPANTRANNGNAPELEPVKIFDNLYAVGNSETTVYALTTSDGIILFDSGYCGPGRNRCRSGTSEAWAGPDEGRNTSSSAMVMPITSADLHISRKSTERRSQRRRGLGHDVSRESAGKSAESCRAARRGYGSQRRPAGETRRRDGNGGCDSGTHAGLHGVHLSR